MSLTISIPDGFADVLGVSAEERDLLRADMLRERLKPVSRPVAKPGGSAAPGMDKSDKS